MQPESVESRREPFQLLATGAEIHVNAALDAAYREIIAGARKLACFVVLGEAGAGKTVFLAKLRRYLRADCTPLGLGAPGEASPARLVHELLRVLGNADPGPVVPGELDELRARL